MLKANHIDDYVVTHQGGAIKIILDAKGHRKLNERLVNSQILRLDLKEGFKSDYISKTEHYDDDSEINTKSLDVLLNYLMAKSNNGSRTLKELLQGAEFVCRRSVLEKIGSAKELHKLGRRSDWSIICERWNGITFMEEEITEKDDMIHEEMTELDKLNSYMGRRFEKYMVHSGQNNNDYLRMVMVSTISDNHLQNPVKVMYSGEIDGVDSNGEFIECKTHRGMMIGDSFWKSKSLHWWLQSRLVDVSYILVGVKDGFGIVTEIRKLHLADLEKNGWSGSACILFLHKALKYMKSWLSNNRACRVTYKNGNLHCEPLPREAAEVVPDYFKDHFQYGNNGPCSRGVSLKTVPYKPTAWWETY